MAAPAAKPAPAGKKDDKKKGGPKVKTVAISKKDFYAVGKDGKVERKKKHCPKCGPGVFLADHKDRVSCGKCGYTEFKKK
jgi:small subunit ribosomal protein S27Ae